MHNSEKHEKYKRENVYQMKEQEFKNRESNSKPRVSLFCEKSGSKASESETVSIIDERRLILARKKLCFNRTRVQHRASECRSNRTCFSCEGKHYTSICDEKANVLLTTNSNMATYPAVIVSVEGVKCRALIDTGYSYVSSKFISFINKIQSEPKPKQYKS